MRKRGSQGFYSCYDRNGGRKNISDAFDALTLLTPSCKRGTCLFLLVVVTCNFWSGLITLELNFIVMEENKNYVADIVPIVSKITEHKLNGSNYIEWSKTIKIYLRSVAKDDHLTEEPPTDITRKLWMQDDAWLFL